MNALLQQFGVFTEDPSIDKQMIPYFGSHSCKIFINGKPIGFGYKNRTLASSRGYPLKFETYVVASEMKLDQSLSPCIVSNLLLIMKNLRQQCVCFDNFFTFHQLLVDLKEKRFRGVETIRENQL